MQKMIIKVRYARKSICNITIYHQTKYSLHSQQFDILALKIPKEINTNVISSLLIGCIGHIIWYHI